MNRIWDMGRKAMFYIRVLSGYEERSIRSRRFKLEQRLRSMQEEKEMVKKIPENVILSEVRQMVDQMKNLNKELEQMETDINEHFKPFDKRMETFMDMQMDRDKKMMQMMKQVALGRAKEQIIAEAIAADKAKMESLSGTFKEALSKKPEAEEKAATKEVSDSQKRESLSALFNKALSKKPEAEEAAATKEASDSQKRAAQ